MQINAIEESRVRATEEGRGLSINVSGLSKSYGARAVLKEIGLSLRAGEFVAVVGRSGCG